MKKKYYTEPQIEEIKMRIEAPLLSGSGEDDDYNDETGWIPSPDGTNHMA